MVLSSNLNVISHYIQLYKILFASACVTKIINITIQSLRVFCCDANSPNMI